jgi:hypothetical protein
LFNSIWLGSIVSQTYAYPGTADTDWDGVDDVNDLDADNDGVTFATECTVPQNSEGSITVGGLTYTLFSDGPTVYDHSVYSFTGVSPTHPAVLALVTNPLTGIVNPASGKIGVDLGGQYTANAAGAEMLITNWSTIGFGPIRMRLKLDDGSFTPLISFSSSLNATTGGSVALYGPATGTSNSYSSSGLGVNVVNFESFSIPAGRKVAGFEISNFTNPLIDMTGVFMTQFVSAVPSSCDTDTDGDGINDDLDLDGDNDGIADMYEHGNAAVTALDTDGNGTISLSEWFVDDGSLANSTGGNGLDDRVENIIGTAGEGVTPLDSYDTAGDDIADLFDLDSDDDGIPDATEARATANYIAYPIIINDASDSDDDGILDIYDSETGSPSLASFGSIKSEFKTSARAPNDDSSDSDDTPDYLDTDSDGDTISDANESDLTTISGVSYADPDGNVNDPLDNADGSIILENADNDSGDVDFRSLEVPPGFTLSSTWSTIWENSGTWSYTIVLNSQPTSDVVIDLSSDDTDEATVSPASLTFTSANWDTAQTVTVTWVNDNLVATHSAVITATINDGSSANEYDPLSDQTHTVTLTDDDTSPSAPTITSVDGDTTDPYLTNDVTPDVIFSAGSWSTVTISWWTCTPTPVWAAWTVTCTPDANLSSGTTTGITPTIADQYGNPTVGTPFSITVDNTDPSTPTVDSLSPNPAQTGTTVTLSLSTVEPGTSVTVPWLTCSPDPVTASGTVDCSWTASWGLLDGSNNIVTVTDPAWNTNTGATSPTLIIDDTAPTLTLTTPTDVTPSNVTAYPITGSCTANGDTIDIAITDGDTPINTATWSVVCTGWSYTGSLDLSGLDDGTMNITVDSTDASGNSATQATDTADKDVLAPTITPNTLPVINEDNQSSLELTGSCTAPWDTISISLTDWSNTATWSTTCWTWGSYTWSLDASSLTDGTIDFIGTINDGTNPAITATGSTTQDTVDPTVTIITSVDVIPGNVATYPVIGSCSANGDTIDITITDGDSPANTATWSTTCTWWAYTWSLDLSGLNDGTLNIASDITDAAWNEATQATDTTDKDVLAPTITLNTIPTINEDTQSAVEVTWSCTAPWDNISFSLTDSTNTASWATTCGSSGTFTWSLDLSGFDDGTINLVATIDDGTNPTITATWATTMDSIVNNPTVDSTSPSPAKDGTSVTTKLSSVEPWASVSIPGMTCSPDPATVSGTVDCIGIVWTGWLDGVNKIVSITDWAGNTNSGSTIVLVIDNTAPVITSSTGVTLPVGASFTDTPPTCSDNTDSSCSVTSSWSVDTATVWIYTITYTATDAAGNTNTTTKTINITLWNPPVITLLGSGSLQVIQSASYTDAGATANDSENGNITSSISATGAVDTSTLWAYIITYNVTDSSGNSATPVTRNVQVISSLNDFDGDGLSNLLEAQLGTDPLKADTDWDGTNDNNNDKDNVTPAIELAAPNAGDGNGDGTIDAIQNAVSSLPNIANAQYNSLEISNAGSCGQIQYFASKRESALWAQDSEFDYDLGLWDFEIACTNTGATANIQIYLDKTYDTSSWVYRKFNEVTDIYTDISSIVNYTTETVWTWSLAVDVTVINYSITDGGTYDEDGVANAIIIDPSGPSVPVVVTGGGWRTYSCRDVDATNYRTYGFSQPDLCEYSSVEEVVVIPNPKSEEEISEKIEIIEELEVIKWEDYTLENSFDHCPIITDIQNPNYPHASTGVFIDESESHFQDLVLKFSEIGIVDGYDDGTFKPLQEMTRTEFLKVALISHCYKYRDLGGNTPYTDVEVGTWQSRVIERAQELKMINGDITEDGISVFRPNDIITKAEATKILMRISMIQAEDTQTTRYSDISVDWHNKYIENGEALGLFDSREDNYSFYPDSGVQREDMVDIINRLVQSYK